MQRAPQAKSPIFSSQNIASFSGRAPFSYTHAPIAIHSTVGAKPSRLKTADDHIPHGGGDGNLAKKKEIKGGIDEEEE
jgi:hypothetical protein